MEVSNNQNGASSGRDRLSNLSDCLLHTILSHLKALQVVRTCLLSRRWRHLWLSAPSADIDSREFRIYRWSQGSSPFDELRDHEIKEVLFGKLEDIVDNLLLHHSTRLLHTLRLRIHIDDQTAPCMRRWIRRALSCAPAVLVIHYGTSIMLPPRSSGTRRLTKLCLDQVSLHGGFEQQITTGLPVLEDLRIKNSDLSNLSRIKSGTLKNLTLDCCHKTDSPFHNNRLVVAAPRLASLHFTIMFHGRASFIVAEAPSLVQASVCLVKKPKQKSCHWKHGSNKMDAYILKDLRELLCSLFNSNNVSSLKLAGFQKMLVHDNDLMFLVPNMDGIPQASRTLKMWMRSDEFVHCPMLQWILEEARGTLPLLGNLRTLILDNCEAGDKIQVLWCFLHNAPVLEMLTLNNCKFSDGTILLGKSSLKPLSSDILDMPPELKLIQIRYSDEEAHQLIHQGARPIDDVLPMIRTKVSATTMIQATKLPKKTRQTRI